MNQTSAQSTLSAPFQNDGYFGPNSVTWRVFLSPARNLGFISAVVVQMLVPQMVAVIDQASHLYKNPLLRRELTRQYYMTAVFGDTFMADRASASLWRLHQMKKALDPMTGQEVHATDTDLLLWTHNTAVWTELRAYERYGPKMSAEEKDGYVKEWVAFAKLAGVDVAQVPTTYADLNAYMDSMTPKLAFTPAAERFRDLLVPQGFTFHPRLEFNRFVSHASVDLLLPVHQELYGLDFSKLYRSGLHGFFHILFALAAREPMDKRVEKARAYVASNPFGNKVRPV